MGLGCGKHGTGQRDTSDGADGRRNGAGGNMGLGGGIHGPGQRETWDGADGRRNGAAGNMGRGSGEHGTGRRGRLLEFMVFMTNITEEK